MQTPYVSWIFQGESNRNICIDSGWMEQFASRLHSEKRDKKNGIARPEPALFLVSNSISSFLSRLIYTCQMCVAAQVPHFRFLAGNYNLHLNSSISSRFLESSGAPSPISCSSSRIDTIISSVFFVGVIYFNFDIANGFKQEVKWPSCDVIISDFIQWTLSAVS
jgi:hypothetical protein